MAQISATTGVVSGIDYNTLINNLIKADSTVSDSITAQNKTLTNEQTAITQLIANLTALKGSTDVLGTSTLFDTTTATSSDSSVLSVTTTGTPASGYYQYTALSKAQSQQSLSSGYETNDATVGEGTISFRFGNSVDTSMNLSNINGGTGFTAGKIKIIDRSGTSATIDLTAARTIDDVLTAINNNGTVGVTASVKGDTIVLTDNTGETTSNLKVQEVGSGKTAASLGLSGINAASNSVTGSDIVYLANNLNLSALNDGIGAEINTSAADISYTLSNGDTGSIILAGSSTVGDIIDKINASSQYLTASLNSDGYITVTDSSGGKGTFTLAADNNSQALSDLGLTGSAVKGVITGTITLGNSTDTLLSNLNGGAGVRMNSALADLTYTLSNGDTGEIKLAGARTLGDVITKINAANTNLQVSIGSDGRHLVLTDSSNGTGTFTVGAENGSKALADLGLTGTAVGGVITGSRIISGAKTVLLSDLKGGNGLGTLGIMNLTDRAGSSNNIDLSGAETLEDVINTINASGLQITAQVNDAGNGIKLVDSSGQTASDLKVADFNDGTTTATKIFGAPVDVAADSANSGDLHLHVIGLGTQLADLNGGTGVAQGKFTVTDSAGKSGTVNVDSNITTIGDVVKAINLLAVGVLAEINQTGDGILIQDTAGGSGTLQVNRNGSSTAVDLNLLGIATTQGANQVIDGSMTRTINISSTATLQNLTDSINNLNAGITASIISDGSDQPYHLSIASNQTGKAGKFILDTSKSGMSFDQISAAQDALLVVGYTSSSTKPTVVSSSTNSFTKVLNGATLTINGVSSNPVTVSVSTDTSGLATQIQSFVNDYNSLRKTLNTDTVYDTSTNTPAVLTGDFSAYEVDTTLGSLVSDIFTSNKTIQSLAQLGITFDSNANDGTLLLDQDKLDSVLNTNLADVKEMFTTANSGVSARFANLVSSLAVDADTKDPKSLLGLHYQALQTTIDNNTAKINDWTVRLDNERNRLIDQFANLETTLAKLQMNYQALNSIQWMLSDSSSSSTSSGSLFNNTSSSSSSSS